MPYLPTAQSWLHQSTLLLQARPTTTRITTKYTIPPSLAPPTNDSPAPPKAHLILKTYDPASGACLKYRTDKAAEVGRLVAALGRCGRVMAALPERGEGEEKMVGEGEGTTGRSTAVVTEAAKPEVEKGRVGGGKKMKKKGRK